LVAEIRSNACVATSMAETVPSPTEAAVSSAVWDGVIGIPRK
jgi:hypothetical protein